VLVPSELLTQAAHLSPSCSPPAGACVLAYVGLGPGQEFIPYFLGLLGVIGTVVVAAVQWPAITVLRWFSRGRPSSQPPAQGDDARGGEAG
jgi:hypothetical protein